MCFKLKVGICIVTYKRPNNLLRLLKAINKLDINTELISLLKVVVVDNDSKQSSKSVIKKIKKKFRWEIIYIVEKRRGIPYARNCAIKNSKDIDYIAFIDDDEIPRKSWLNELVKVQQKYSADVVSGKVIREFEEKPPKWIVHGRFFHQPDRPTGTSLKLAATNNVLIKKSILESDSPFNERFALSGGSDTYFFMGLYLSGAKIIWANNAVVVDKVPVSRLNARWLIQRAYRSGITLSICIRDYEKSRFNKFKRLLKGIGRIIQGVLLLLPSFFKGKGTVVKSIQYISRGVGNIMGLIGVQYDEYKKIHGN